MLKRKMSEMKKVKTDKSCSIANKSTSTSDNSMSDDLMDTCSGDFKDIRNMPAFVDKTMLIKPILMRKHRAILLTAPRRFGKSINLSMLKRFFELSLDSEEMKKNRKLFEGTLIADHKDIMERHQGKYPVLFLDFKSQDTVSSLDDARDKISRVVQKAFRRHKYLASESSELDNDEKKFVKKWRDHDLEYDPVKNNNTILDALTNLAIYLSKFWKKEVIILSDEYDSICSDSCLRIQDEVELNNVIALCQGTLSCILKSSNCEMNIARGILTGISYVMTMGLNKLGNVDHYQFQADHNFSEFYGITETKLKSLNKIQTNERAGRSGRIL